MYSSLREIEQSDQLCPWARVPFVLGRKLAIAVSLSFITLSFNFFQLVPLFVVVGAGCVGAGYYLMRLALKNPDATYVYERLIDLNK